jgi:hypothetical protein
MALSVSYKIRVTVKGNLPASWSSMFGDVAVTPGPDGTSVLTGQLPDQAAVHGLLGVVRDLGLSLIAAETYAIPQTEPETGGQS